MDAVDAAPREEAHQVLILSSFPVDSRVIQALVEKNEDIQD